MKSLILVRHAEATPSSRGQLDIDRKLNQKGLQDAHAMGYKIFDADLIPSLILASPASRTQQTAALIAGAIRYHTKDIQTDNRIFDNTVDLLMEVVHDLDDNLDTVMLVGHNPGLTGLLHWLCDSSSLHLNTCCVAQIEFDSTHWIDVSPDSGQCRWFCCPSL